MLYFTMMLWILVHLRLARFTITGGLHEYAVKEEAKKRKRLEAEAEQREVKMRSEHAGRSGKPTRSSTTKYSVVGKNKAKEDKA